MHLSAAAQGAWVASVVRGYFAYHAVPMREAEKVERRRLFEAPFALVQLGVLAESKQSLLFGMKLQVKPPKPSFELAVKAARIGFVLETQNEVVRTNVHALAAFRVQVTRHWHRALRRRGQKRRIDWVRMGVIAERWLPRARILHPWPESRFDARTRGRSRVR